MRKWELTYKGHAIRIEAGVFTKRLFIDGKLKAMSGLGMSIELMGKIEGGEGAGEPVIARLEGLWPSKCDLVTKDDLSSSQGSGQDQAFRGPEPGVLNVIIRGEGPTSDDAWKEVFEGFRRKFPNLASYNDKELGEILRKNGVKFTQVFGERKLVEANLENQAHSGERILEALSQSRAKNLQ